MRKRISINILGRCFAAHTAVAKLCESMAGVTKLVTRILGDRSMNRILIAGALMLSSFVAGCQSSTQGPPLGEIPPWRFPCNYRAFDAGRCDDLNGLPNTDFNLSARIFG